MNKSEFEILETELSEHCVAGWRGRLDAGEVNEIVRRLCNLRVDGSPCMVLMRARHPSGCIADRDSLIVQYNSYELEWQIEVSTRPRLKSRYPSRDGLSIRLVPGANELSPELYWTNDSVDGSGERSEFLWVRFPIEIISENLWQLPTANARWPVSLLKRTRTHQDPVEYALAALAEMAPYEYATWDLDELLFGARKITLGMADDALSRFVSGMNWDMSAFVELELAGFGDTSAGPAELVETFGDGAGRTAETVKGWRFDPPRVFVSRSFTTVGFHARDFTAWRHSKVSSAFPGLDAAATQRRTVWSWDGGTDEPWRSWSFTWEFSKAR